MRVKALSQNTQDDTERHKEKSANA
jgi:hypothetical protein